MEIQVEKLTEQEQRIILDALRKERNYLQGCNETKEEAKICQELMTIFGEAEISN